MTMSTADTNVLYGYGGDGLQRSNDGGITWKIVNVSEQVSQLTTHSTDPSTVYATSPSVKGILVSHDQGVTWQSLSESLIGGVVHALAISPHDERVMLTSSQKLGGLAETHDGGKIWKLIAERFGDETVTYIAYDKNTHGTVYALTHTNRIFKSIDNGATWAFIR